MEFLFGFIAMQSLVIASEVAAALLRGGPVDGDTFISLSDHVRTLSENFIVG